MITNKSMLLIAIFACAFAAPAFSQQTLPAFLVIAKNYKYLKNVGGKEVAVPVQRLQRSAASYDVVNSEYYEEDYESYFISFYIPEGEILAAYDKDGKLIRTAEKYKNVKLPEAVTKAVVTRFPNWSIANDVYMVNYFENTGKTTKTYKLVLKNGTKRIRVETNEKGEFS